MNQVVPSKSISIQSLRKLKDKRQQDVADAIGMAQSTYAYKESHGSFDDHEKKMIAKFLNTDMSLIVWTKTSTGQISDEKDKTIQRQQEEIIKLRAEVKTLQQMIDKLLQNR